MFAGTRQFLSFIWPFLECLILATILGYEFNNRLSTMIIIFVFMLFVNYYYEHGYWIRIIGWGAIGLTLGTNFYLLSNGLLFVLLFVGRFLTGYLIKKFVL